MDKTVNQFGESGFTLFEIIVVMGIVAILALVALPAMRDTMQGGQRAAGLGDAMSMIAYARSEAVALQRSVAVCPSTDQAACSGNNWEDGWILFVDDGQGGGTAEDGDRNGTEQMLRIGTSSSGAVTIRSHNFADAGALELDALGMVPERGTIMVCDSGGAPEALGAVINLSGQSRLATDDNLDVACLGCIEQDDGTEATCP
jgi:type IV fimbrial biogenesis protein FimT